MSGPAYRISPMTATAIVARRADLAELLVACFEAGGSLGFRAPLSSARAGAAFDDVAHHVGTGAARFLIADTGGTLIGCIGVFAESRESEPHLATLGKLMVHPACRRCGIGGALITDAERAALAWGKSRLYLFTTDDGAAPALYDRMGYQCVGRLPEGGGLPDGHLMDALIFSKTLTGDLP